MQHWQPRWLWFGLAGSAALSLMIFAAGLPRSLEREAAGIERMTLDARTQLERALGTLLVGVDTVGREVLRSDVPVTALAPLFSSLRRDLPAVRTIIVLDADGTVVADMRVDQPALGVNVADREYYQVHARETGYARFFGPPVESRIDGTLTFPLSTPLRDPNGTLQAVIVASVEMDYFASAAAALSGKGKALYAFDENHGTCFRLDRARSEPQLHHERCDFLADMVGTELSSGESPVLRQSLSRELAFLSRTGAWPLEIAVFQDNRTLRNTALLNALPLPILVLLGSASLAGVLLRQRRRWLREQTETRTRTQLTERLQMATAGARVGIWDWDISTDRLYWSDVMKQIHGINPQEEIASGQHFFDHIADADRDRVRRAVDAHLEEQTPFIVTYHAFRETGNAVVLRATGQVTRDSLGKPVRMLGMARDVTAEVDLEERLLAAEEMARIGNWIYEIGKEDLIWSPQVFRIYGIEPYSVTPTTELVFDLIHEEDRAHIAEALRATIEDDAPFEVDFRVNSRSGHLVHARSKGRVEKNKAGQVVRIFGVMLDRTEIVEKERDLERAQRLQAFGQLAGGVAHDFNNLLAVMLGNLELLQDPSTRIADTDRKRHVDETIQAVLRARDLTQGLLSFARTAHLKPVDVAPGAVLDTLVPLLRRTLPATIAIDVADKTQGLQVHVDLAGLEACLLNLAINARDAMANMGQLTMEIRAENLTRESIGEGEADLHPGPYVVFSVRDTGPGIPPDLHSLVFEPFFTTKEVGKGSGLGLSRVKGFAEQSGGTVRLSSRDGKGTEMCLYLPAVEGDPGASASEGGVDGPDPKRQGANRVLFVEDLEAVRRVVTRHLESFGLDVTTCETGDAAVALLREDADFDLLVTDMVMPGQHQGTQVAATALSFRPQIGVVYMTGHPLGNEDAIAEGAPEGLYLTKPVTTEELSKAVSEALGGTAR